MEVYDLDREFQRLIQRFPNANKQLVRSSGEKMFNKAIGNIQSSTDEQTGNLLNGCELVYGSGGGYAAVKPNQSVAPHTHLLENGHKIVRGGQVVGWAEGKHMYRNALNDLANELEQDAERMINDLMGGF